MPTSLSSDFRLWSYGLSSIRRTAVCGPACTVVWQGRRGDPSPYADCSSGFELSCAQVAGDAVNLLAQFCEEVETALLRFLANYACLFLFVRRCFKLRFQFCVDLK